MTRIVATLKIGFLSLGVAARNRGHGAGKRRTLQPPIFYQTPSVAPLCCCASKCYPVSCVPGSFAMSSMQMFASGLPAVGRSNRIAAGPMDDEFAASIVLHSKLAA